MREGNVWQVGFFREEPSRPLIKSNLERGLRVEDLEDVHICNIVVDPVSYLCESLEGVRIVKAVQYLPPGNSSRLFFTTTPVPPGWLVASTGVRASDIFGCKLGR